jgi:hypothetical protein
MKKLTVLAIFLSAVQLSLAADNKPWLGSWKSNKAATLQYLRANTKLTPEQLEKLGTALGRMVIVIEAERITLRDGDWKFASKYKVLSESKSSVTIESVDPETRRLTKSTIEFDGDGFWTPAEDKIPGYKERFDKIKGP